MNTVMNIVEQIKIILLARQWHLSVSESLTGGLCQASLVECPGISQVFLGGVVSYTNEIKQRVLNVDKTTLLCKTAVSQEVAEQMALGMKQLFQSDVSISFTGEAGPFVQQGELGQVYIAIVINNDIFTYSLQLKGLRNSIRQQAVKEGLLKLLQCLREVD